MIWKSSFFIALVAAVNQAPNVPLGAQVGALRFGITCDIPLLGRKTFATYLSATAATQAFSGQDTYFDDVIVTVTVPKSLTQLATLLGAKYADADVKMSLKLDNAVPAEFDVFPTGLHIDHIGFNRGEDTKILIPANGTLQPLGPITLGEGGKAGIIHFGDIAIGLSLYNNAGRKLLGPLGIKCPVPAINYDLGVVNVLTAETGSAPGPFAPTTGGDNIFAPVAHNEQTGSFRFPYTCDLADAFKQDVDLSITGTVPAILKPGVDFSAKDGYAYLRLPPQFVGNAQTSFPGAASVRINVESYEVGVTNGSPAFLNALTSPQVTTVQLTPGKEVAAAIPQDSLLSIGPFKALSTKEELFITSSNATGIFDFLDSSGKSVGSTKFECSPKGETKLIGIIVTDRIPPAISK